MRILIGIKHAQAMERTLEYRKQEMEIHIVETKREFLLHVSGGYDVICVDSGIFTDMYPWLWMSDIKQQAKENIKVYIALDANVYDSALLSIIEKLAVDYDFNLISVQPSVENTAHAFANQLFGVETYQSPVTGGRFITVMSAAPGDGATTIAINAAIAVASKTRLRVALIDGNLKNPMIRSNLNLSDRLKSNFQIRSKLQTATLDSASLESACVVHPKLRNLFILPGSSRRETASDVSPEMIFELMSVARRTFHITIMDVSTFADNAATICGVRFGDDRWLVAQNNYSSYRISWNEWFESYWHLCGLNSSQFNLVANRVQDQNVEDMLGQLKMELIAKIPNVPGGLGIKSVHDGIPLYFQQDTDDFITAIHQAANSIAGDESDQIAAATSETKRVNLWRKVFG